MSFLYSNQIFKTHPVKPESSSTGHPRVSYHWQIARLHFEVRNLLLCNACTGVTPLKMLPQVELSGWTDPGWSAFAIIYSGSTLLEGCKVLLINGLGFPHLLAACQQLYKRPSEYWQQTEGEPDPSLSKNCHQHREKSLWIAHIYI